MQLGLNSVQMQRNNRTQVIKALLEKGTMTRADLATYLGLQKATITNIINEFFSMNIVRVEGAEASGRRGEKLRLVLDDMYTMSIGITRKDYQIALYTLTGTEVEHRQQRFREHEHLRDAIGHLKCDIGGLIEQYSDKRIFDICLAVPGLYIKDVSGGREVYMISEFEQWNEIDIRRELESAAGRSIEIVYDAKLAAYAEWRNAEEVLRSRPDASLAVVRSRGFGIGAGFVIGGKIIEGQMGIAGEVGHVGINYRAKSGKDGTYESSAGCDSAVKYMLERLHEYPDSPLTEQSGYYDIVDQYEKGDPLAVWSMEKLAWLLGYGLVNMIYTINPDCIIIGADYPASDAFIAKVKAALYEHVPSIVVDNMILRSSRLTKDSFLLGGNYYSINKLCDDNLIFDKICAIMA